MCDNIFEDFFIVSLFVQLRIGFVDELLRVYGEARVLALADQSVVVKDLDLKVEPSAVTGDQLAFAQDTCADRGGCEVLDLYLSPYRGDTLAQVIFDRFGTASLDQGDHRRGREDPQRTAAHRDRGVFDRDSD